MRCAKLVDGLSLEASEGAAGCVVRGGRATVRLPNHAVAVLLLCDGSRGAVQVSEALGHRIAPHVIEKLTDQLGELGILGFIERIPEIETLELAPVRHECHSCGGSCEGSMVGPLPESRVASLRPLHAELSERYERVAAHAPVVYRVTTDGDRIPFLNFPERHCVFLADDKLCLLHRHYGMAAKPEACRRFPITAIEADGMVRVGIRPMCFRNQRSMNATDVDLAYEAQGAPSREPSYLPPPSSPHYGDARAQSVSDEARFLGWLTEEAITLEELIYRVAEHAPKEPPRQGLSPDFLAALAPILSRASEVFDAQLEDAPVTLFGRRLRELIVLMPRLSEVEHTSSSAMPAAARRFILESMRRAVFLREFEYFPSVSLGIFTLSLGALLCSWFNEGPLVDAEGAVDDHFAELFVAWTRLMCQPERFFLLFEQPEHVDAALSAL